MSNPHPRSLVHVLGFLVLVLVCIVNARSQHYGGPIGDRFDSHHYLRLAYNLHTNQRFSLKADGSKLTLLREPGYPAVLALAMALGPTPVEISFHCLKRGDPSCLPVVQRLRWANAVLLAITGLLTAWACWFFSGRIALAYPGFLLVTLNSSTVTYTNYLATENLALPLLLLTSIFAALAVRKRVGGWYAATGLTAGLLALTKAVFVLLVPVLLPWLLWVWWSSGYRWRQVLGSGVALVGCFSLVVGAWMVRNYVQLDQFKLASRGGEVLALRATYNEMKWNEIKAAVYYWNPAYGEPYVVKHFPRADYVRLSRNTPRGYYYYARWGRQAELEKEEGEYDFGRDALQRMLANPDKHLFMTLLIAYRGMFILRELEARLADTLSFRLRAPMVMSLTLYLSFLAALMLGLWRRNWSLITFLFPALFVVGFHAFLTHGIVRYTEPVLPICLVTLTLWLSLLRGRSEAGHNSSAALTRGRRPPGSAAPAARRAAPAPGRDP